MSSSTELKQETNDTEIYSDEEYDYSDYNDYNDLDDDFGEDNESMDDTDIYQKDPEHFDYTCYSLEKIDWIVERKCERLIECLGLQDSIDALFLLKKFKWNVQKIIDKYEQDEQAFLQTYFSDNNNNNDVKASANSNRSMLLTYVNIFNNESKIFSHIKPQEEAQQLPVALASKQYDTYCDICCTNQLNIEQDMAAAIDECSHYFCRECWRMHFESLINESFWNRFAATSRVFECMQTKCKAIASKDFVLNCLKYNINNNEDSYSAGDVDRPTSCDPETTPIWRKTLQYSNTTRSLSGRYKQLVALDLVKESEDIQLCPGDIIIQEKSNAARTALSSQANSPSFNSILLNTLSTPGNNSFINSKVLQSAKTSSDLKPTQFSMSSSFPKTSHMAKMCEKLEVQECVPTITRKCNAIVWIKSKVAARRVKCTDCNTKYCFLCLLPYHAPNSCSLIKKWLGKCEDDSETRNYLLVYTQDCPKCRVRIEKNGGCSHMTCNRCKHEFCWVCTNDWKSHGASYDCNRYKGNPKQDEAREALNRYTHYYHRWINHANSLKFEKAFKEQCELKIQEKIMNKEGGTLVDWEFLSVAVEYLTRARFTLQYTYPYAFYLEESDSKKMLFENIQAELERDVENLSHSLEKVTLNDKFNIESQMNIVEKRRKTLLLDFNV